MSAAILGLGQVSALGSGLLGLDGTPAPVDGVLRAPAASPAGVDPRLLRRLDPFASRALAAASQAMLAAGDAGTVAPERQALLVATGWGPVRSSFTFLEETRVRGDGLGSPTTFSNSAHGAAAGALATVLGLRGPMATITGSELPWAEALAMALDLLHRRADRVLLVSADEHHPLTGLVPASVARASTLRLGPGERTGASPTWGETFTAFVLGREGRRRIHPPRAFTEAFGAAAHRPWPWGWNGTADAMQVLVAAARGETARCVACAPGGGSVAVDVEA